MHSLWIQAVAGSGKTTSIVRNISNLVNKNILCLSFTKSAVSTMQAAIGITNNITINTIHGFAASLTNSNVLSSRTLKDATWQIIWQENKEEFAEIFSDKFRDEIENSQSQSKYSALWHELHNALKASFEVVSYDDLLHNAIEYLKYNPEKIQYLEYIFVDEAQDLTSLQWEFIMALISANPDISLNVVGDENQIIYRFQGSSRDIWQKQLQWWMSLPGKRDYQIKADCYRCKSAIIGIINKLFQPQHTPYQDGGNIIVYPPIKDRTEYINSLVTLVQTFPNPEEVLILLKRRGTLSQSIIRTFINAGIKISGLTDSVLETSATNYEELFTEGNSTLIQLAAEYNTQSIGNFKDFRKHIKSQTHIFTNSVPGHVRLLTIHAAKGLEAEHVIIADAYDSPYRMTTDRTNADIDNKCLLYVALTRAKQTVTLCGTGTKVKGSFGEIVSSVM